MMILCVVEARILKLNCVYRRGAAAQTVAQYGLFALYLPHLFHLDKISLHFAG